MAFIPMNSGSGGGLTETDLWTNPSPTSSFGSDTVTLSQSYKNFDYLKISFRWSTSDSTSFSAIIPKATLESNVERTFAIGGNLSSSGKARTRVGYASSETSIYISNSYQLVTTTQSANSNYIIPTKISGLK